MFVHQSPITQDAASSHMQFCLLVAHSVLMLLPTNTNICHHSSSVHLYKVPDAISFKKGVEMAYLLGSRATGKEAEAEPTTWLRVATSKSRHSHSASAHNPLCLGCTSHNQHIT